MRLAFSTLFTLATVFTAPVHSASPKPDRFSTMSADETLDMPLPVPKDQIGICVLDSSDTKISYVSRYYNERDKTGRMHGADVAKFRVYIHDTYGERPERLSFGCTATGFWRMSGHQTLRQALDYAVSQRYSSKYVLTGWYVPTK